MKHLALLLCIAFFSCKKGVIDESNTINDQKAANVNKREASLSLTDFTLAFEDNFDGTALNTNVWNYRTGIKTGLDCANRAENVSVSGGNMIIDLKAEPYSGVHYTCGGIITKAVYKYGYYETRAKLPPSSFPGWHSSFWLYGAPSNNVNEIDCFEVESSHPTDVYTNTHHWDGTHYSTGQVLYNGVNTSSAFHVYGFEWTPSVVNFYVDGALINTTRYLDPHALQQIWLSSLTLNTNQTAVGGTQVLYDYFRAYTKDYPDEVMVDNNDNDNTPNPSTSYSESGTGWTGSSLPGYIRTTRATKDLNSYVQWTPNVKVAGTYKVYIYRVADPYSDPNAKITIYHNGTTNNVYLNYSTGTSNWMEVGTYDFAVGTGGYIRNTLNTANKWCRADAIRMVKQ